MKLSDIRRAGLAFERDNPGVLFYGHISGTLASPEPKGAYFRCGKTPFHVSIVDGRLDPIALREVAAAGIMFDDQCKRFVAQAAQEKLAYEAEIAANPPSQDFETIHSRFD